MRDGARSLVSLSGIFLACFAACAAGLTAKAGSGSTSQHVEQSAVLLSDHDTLASDLTAPAVTAASGAEIKLESSMALMLGDDDDDDDDEKAADPASPKAELQRKLVALIWLEKVLQANVDSMDESTYSAKIAKAKAGLAKDTTPATAAMLSQMRMEIHEFSAPFYQNAVKDELHRIQKRQKVFLDKIIALDAGADPATVEKIGEESGEDSSPDASGSKAAKPDKKEKKKKERTAEEIADRKKRQAQAQYYTWMMGGTMAVLTLILVGIAIKVKTHVRST